MLSGSRRIYERLGVGLEPGGLIIHGEASGEGEGVMGEWGQSTVETAAGVVLLLVWQRVGGVLFERAVNFSTGETLAWIDGAEVIGAPGAGGSRVS